MRQLNHYCFSLENVIFPSLNELIDEELPGRVSSLDRYDLTLALSSGKIALDKFWQRILSSTDLKMERHALEEKVINGYKPVDGIIAVLKELRNGNSLSLFSQLPRGLFTALSARSGLNELFSDSDIYFTSEMNLENTTTDVVNHLMAGKCLIPGKSVLVDADSRRTSAAIRAGMDAIIFVDARRLRREIALRGLLPKLGDE